MVAVNVNAQKWSQYFGLFIGQEKQTANRGGERKLDTLVIKQTNLGLM